MTVLKCHYDENRILSIKAIFKYKQVACMKRKMLFTFFKNLFFFPEIFKFLKYANCTSDDVRLSKKQETYLYCRENLNKSKNQCALTRPEGGQH